MRRGLLGIVLLCSVILTGCFEDGCPLGPSGTSKYVVNSQGFNVPDNGHLVTLFGKNGKVLTSGYQSFNIVAIDSADDDLIKPIVNFEYPVTYDLKPGIGFNTYGNRHNGAAMNAMIDFLNHVPNGTLLLIGVYDEAGLTESSFSCLPNPTPDSVCCKPLTDLWVERAQQAFEALGATKLRRYCYRNSYSFITTKGFGPQAEELTNGIAAVAQYSLSH